MEQTVITNLDAMAIQKYQQNRYPSLFIDFVEEAIPGKSAKGHKNFSYNEWYFPAHFADEPNVPGFVQVEALTQMFLMTFLTISPNLIILMLDLSGMYLIVGDKSLPILMAFMQNQLLTFSASMD